MLFNAWNDQEKIQIVILNFSGSVVEFVCDCFIVICLNKIISWYYQTLL